MSGITEPTPTHEADAPRRGRNNVKIDAFHDGGFECAQLEKSGHRAGLDAMLLGASLPGNALGMLADLGAGCGVAGLAALNLYRDLDLVSVEFNDEMFDLLQRTAQLPANARFHSRIRPLQADVTKSGADRLEQGLQDNTFDYVIMNPPYNTGSYRPPVDKVRREAYSLGEGGLDAWLRTAAAIMRQGGMLSMIYRTENLGSVMACCQGRFGGLEILPVHSRAGEAAKRIIVRATKGSRAPLSILPGFVVHQEDGSPTRLADDIFRGKATLGL
ncbi:MAG: methyltransferase [Pseudomonadota bacterium]